MSFAAEKRTAIIKYMLDKIRDGDRDFVKKTGENFGISETSVRRYIKECQEKGVLLKDTGTAFGWKLSTQSGQWEFENDGYLEEDNVFRDKIAPFLKEVSPEATDIWYYAFAEIMNNAIEHSRGDRIRVSVQKDCLYTEISIVDNGVGIFRNIQEYVRDKLGARLSTEQAALELYKGKLTTDPDAHSGEGIFFVSKMLDEFAVWSENTIYSYRCGDRDRFVQSHLVSYYTGLEGIGTMAVMKLDNESKRTSREVFDEFAPLEEGFVRTLIPVREMCTLSNPVARSEARRILRRLDEFHEVIFDFQGIEFMGQGFADEVFRVFQNRHPEITLTAVNANASIQGMIHHVRKGKVTPQNVPEK